MTDAHALERAYRRLLNLYPKWFRQDHEDEMIGVLLASAGDGRTRPGLAESLDLTRSAFWMHLRPRAPKSRGVVAAVRFMYLGSFLQLVALLTSLVTIGSVKAAVVAHYPALTAAQWHYIVATQVVPAQIAAPITAVLWASLAWASGRGMRWAKVAFAVLFGFFTLGLLGALGQGDAIYATADVIADGLQWLAGFLALVLIVRDATRAETVRPPAGATW